MRKTTYRHCAECRYRNTPQCTNTYDGEACRRGKQQAEKEAKEIVAILNKIREVLNGQQQTARD